MTKHFNENHPQHKIGDNSYPALYWMIVIPGLDHLRLNASKSIIQAYMFFRDTFKILGYQTPSAQNVAYNASDLHKSEQGLGALMEAGSQYLLKVYSESNDTSQVDFEGFEQFIKAGDKKTRSYMN